MDEPRTCWLLNRNVVTLEPCTQIGSETGDVASSQGDAWSSGESDGRWQYLREDVVTNSTSRRSSFAQQQMSACSITNRCPEGTRNLASCPSVKAKPNGSRPRKSNRKGIIGRRAARSCSCGFAEQSADMIPIDSAKEAGLCIAATGLCDVTFPSCAFIATSFRS